MKYPLISIKCGNNDFAGMWVSIGYRSKSRKQHVLHIVAGDETGAQLAGRNLTPMYFEGDDQSLSCYEGADKILVTDCSITVMLNKNGQDALELPKSIEFLAQKPGQEFKKARAMFQEMQKRKSGEVIHLT